MTVERHGANGAELPVGILIDGSVVVIAADAGGSLRHRSALRFQCTTECIPACFREEVTFRHELDIVLTGKHLGALADHHHVRRALHDESCEAYWILHARHAGNGAGLQRAAVHDGGIEFVASFAREDGAAACVEQRLIFEDPNSGLDGVEAGAAAGEDSMASLQRSFEGASILLLKLRCHGVAADGAGAAVNHHAESRPGRGRYHCGPFRPAHAADHQRRREQRDRGPLHVLLS
jgi:hypothetical protein